MDHRSAASFGSALALLTAVALHAFAAEVRSTSSLRAVVIVLVGDIPNEGSMEARIRSLFTRRTEVRVRRQAIMASGTVLNPEEAHTVYLWIAVGSDDHARFYASTRGDSIADARYLFRELDLESGLDELGRETLAQVAHGCATALWVRDQETPKAELIGRLAQEADRPASRAQQGDAAPNASPVNMSSVASSPRSRIATGLRLSGSVQPSDATRRDSIGATIGAQHAIYNGGDEGWLNQSSLFGMVTYGHFGVKLSTGYLFPGAFEAGPTRVRLDGYAADVTIAWLTKGKGPRFRLEAGVGSWDHRWRTVATDSAVDGEPTDATRQGHDWRAYLIGAASFEFPIDPIWLGVRLDLLAPFQRTYYEVIQFGVLRRVAESWLFGGGGVVVGVPL